MSQAQIETAARLLQENRPREAETVLRTAFQGNQRSDHTLLAQAATLWKALDQPAQALALHERAATLYPDSVAAHHNLAASRGDLGDFGGAERSTRQAFARGGDAPQTWLVHARALQGQNRLDEADHAYREAIRRNQAYVDAHRDLAQLIWMRSEDAGAATSTLDAAIRAQPTAAALLEIRANLLSHAGDAAGAYATLRQPRDVAQHAIATHLAIRAGETQAAIRHAEIAIAGDPQGYAPLCALFVACMATGALPRAAAIANQLAASRPLDQTALAYQATAWRLLGDPRYAARYDYRSLVCASQLDVPPGWPTLPAYLADLAEALGGVHAFRTHPLDQSLRHGSQAAYLKTSTNPVIQAFFHAVEGPIRRHLAGLGTGPDPVRARNTGGYAFQGVWSVRLRPGGFHTDHVHPQGWLSSACYIALPEAADSASREAWIKFGQPGLATLPPLDADHFIRPEPGMLVLFPSYMWHGTVPFTSPGARLSVAFDLRPG